MENNDSDWNIKENNYFIGDDTELDFNINDFNIISQDFKENRIIKPKFNKKSICIKYENAKQLAKRTVLFPSEELHAIIKGNFIFGDYIEALLVEKNVKCKNMYISTLSLSQNNIDSLKGLMTGGYINNLNMIISNYFYSHEKFKLLPYMLDNLDIDNRFNVGVIRNHTKVCLMEIENIKLIITGSANLRSSNCIEQFVIQENKELYNFYLEWFDENLNIYSIINNGVKK